MCPQRGDGQHPTRRGVSSRPSLLIKIVSDSCTWYLTTTRGRRGVSRARAKSMSLQRRPASSTRRMSGSPNATRTSVRRRPATHRRPQRTTKPQVRDAPRSAVGAHICGSGQVSDDVCSKLGQLAWAFCGIGDPEGPSVRGHAHRGSGSTGGRVVGFLVELDSAVG